MLAPSQNEIAALGRVVAALDIPPRAVLPEAEHEELLREFKSSLPAVVKTVVLEDEVDILDELVRRRVSEGSTPALEHEIDEVNKRIAFAPCFEPAKTMLKAARLVHHVRSLGIETQWDRRDDDIDRKLIVLACMMDVHAGRYAESHMNSTGHDTNEEDVQKLTSAILEDTEAFFKERLSFDLFPDAGPAPTVFLSPEPDTGASLEGSAVQAQAPSGAYRGVLPQLLETVVDLESFPGMGAYDHARMHEIVTKPIPNKRPDAVEAMARALCTAPDRIVAMILCGGVMVGGLPSVLLTLQKVHAQEMSGSASIDARKFPAGPVRTVHDAKLASNVVHAMALLDDHLPSLASLCSSPGSAGAGVVFSSTAGVTIAIAAAVMLVGALDYKLAAQFTHAFGSGGLSAAMSTWKPSDERLRKLYAVVMEGGLASKDSVIATIASFASLTPPIPTNPVPAPVSASWDQANGVNMAWSAIVLRRVRSLAALDTRGGDFWSDSILLVRRMRLFGDMGFPSSVFEPSALLEKRVVRTSAVYDPSMPCTLNSVLLWGLQPAAGKPAAMQTMAAPDTLVEPPAVAKRRRTMNSPMVDEVFAAFEFRKLVM